MPLKMTRDELTKFIAEQFPQVEGDFGIDEVREDGVRVRLYVTDANLRPGGTVSGPAMFSLADVTMYIIVLSQIGPQALAVTTNCSIDFMRKPVAGRDLIAEGKLLKLGRALAVGDVRLYSEGSEKPVARAALTYSIPPK